MLLTRKLLNHEFPVVKLRTSHVLQSPLLTWLTVTEMTQITRLTVTEMTQITMDMFCFLLYFHLFCKGIHILFMLFVFIHVYSCLTRFPTEMLFELFNSNMQGSTFSSPFCSNWVYPKFLVGFVLLNLSKTSIPPTSLWGV